MTPLNKQFFQKHQRTLLRLVNSPILGRDMRQALWLPDSRAPIVKLTPNAAHEWLGGDKYRATLYSNKQYAEAMHRSFAWLWKTAHAWDMTIANRLHPALNLGLDTYSSQPDETSGKDTYISSVFTTSNYDADDFMGIGERNDGTETWRSLIKFDFSSIPTGAISGSKIFSLWVRTDLSSNARTVGWYRCKRAWVETQATWNVYSTGNSWQTAGAAGSNDRETTNALALTVSATATGEQQWTTGANPALIDAMFGTLPSFANNGFVLIADTESNDAFLWNTSRYGTPGQRPKAVINYVYGGGAWWQFA